MKSAQKKIRPDKQQSEKPPALPWGRRTGEGSATALDSLKQIERTRKKIVPKSDDSPSAS